MPRLTRIAARRHGEVHIAVGRDEEGDFRTALGNAASGSREQPRSARPFSSRMKKQDVQFRLPC